MILGKLDIDPSRFPAVLDTATWDPAATTAEILRHRDVWPAVADAGLRGTPYGRPAGTGGGVPRVSSIVARAGQAAFLVELSDSQMVFLQVGPPQGDGLLGKPFFQLGLSGGLQLAAYPSDASVVDLFCRTLRPPNAPRALGQTPRLGIGTRMTSRLWPGVFDAMDRKGFAANAIQNSVRELNLLDDLRQGAPPERNYASGFGMIESGYTGSTFEGLWVAGVLAALRHERPLAYGADADHIQLKRADPRLERTLRVVDAARYYTFFTIDAADVLSYEALSGTVTGLELARRAIPDEKERRDVLSWHEDAGRGGHGSARISPDTIGRCVGKYWAGLRAAGLIAEHIAALRPGIPYDLEFAFDEHPPEIAGPDCITSDEELVFVAREIARRRLPVTHLAPNFGVEKGFDYRLADGLDALEKRIASQHRIAQELGFLLDIHSADDLSSATRRAIGRATSGKVHFKISPSLHMIFAETVRDCAPEVFQLWWNDAVGYARAEAGRGSRFAADCVAAWESGAGDRSPSPSHDVFRHFFFAYPGRRDRDGRFINRRIFYELPEELYRLYQERASAFLCGISDDLFAR
jgi:hypothetical protein